jgi:Sec-independent protein secretion pathway component TatC
MKTTTQRLLNSKGLHPNSDHLHEVQRLSTYASLVVLILAPFVAAFDIRPDVTQGTWAFIVIAHTIADLIILGESVTRSTSGYFVSNEKGEQNVLVNNLQENFLHHLTSFLAIDVLSCIPVILMPIDQFVQFALY